MASFYMLEFRRLKIREILGKDRSIGFGSGTKVLWEERIMRRVWKRRERLVIVCRWNRVNLNMAKSGNGKVRKSGTGMTRKEDESTDL